jgi:hypothetical protein
MAERAIALASARGDGPLDPDRAAKALAAAGDRAALEQAQNELSRRIHVRSDDYEATAGLRIVNRALAVTGWPNPYGWKHRRKP